MAAVIKTRGLIVGEAPMGEQDKRLTVLCADRGKLGAIAKGAKKPGSRVASQAQLFYYCDFTLEQSRGFWIIREASVIEGFYELRKDIEKLAWASWMCETARTFAVEGEGCEELLRLLIRGLKLIGEARLSDRMTATAFVLRAMALQGLTPETDRCGRCGQHIWDGGVLSASSNGMVCNHCAAEVTDAIPVTEGGLYTLQYILETPPEKMYKFTASEEIQSCLFQFTKAFLHSYVQREMSSLNFIENLFQF